jgi:hypothetical protein
MEQKSITNHLLSGWIKPFPIIRCQDEWMNNSFFCHLKNMSLTHTKDFGEKNHPNSSIFNPPKKKKKWQISAMGLQGSPQWMNKI